MPNTTSQGKHAWPVSCRVGSGWAREPWWQRWARVAGQRRRPPQCHPISRATRKRAPRTRGRQPSSGSGRRGSACSSKSLKASHVLLAMDVDIALAQGSLVFSLIESLTEKDVQHFLEVFPPIIDRLRKMSPLYTEYLEEKGN